MAKLYISSTHSDLKEYRVAVYDILRKMRHDVIAMEDYVAADQRPLDKCLADVEGCDIYIGIFAWRYGYVPDKDNPEGKSITELEFRQAVKKGKSCLILLLDENAPWPRSQVERGEGGTRIEALRAELAGDYLASFFRSPEDLASQVGAAVYNLEEKRRGAEKSSSVGQAAAVCYRRGPEQIEFLLVHTSGGRWLFPKGKIEQGEEPWEAAEREAQEEAGAIGEIDRQLLTTFRHEKRELKLRGQEFSVAAFLLKVSRTFKPREPKRDPQWFTPEGAEAALSEDREFRYAEELRRVVREACAAIGGSLKEA